MYNDVREFYIGTYRSGYYQKRRNPKGFLTVLCLYLCLCSSVCYYPSFSCTLKICKYLGLVIMLNYIAALLTLSTKDFLSHLFTIQPADDMVICSLNVRGLSNNTKRRETFLWLKKKSSLFTFCKRCIAQMRQNLIGILNGDQIRLFLQPSQALGEALLYCSTTIFNFKF